MKYAYFPGCSLESTGKEFDVSTNAVAESLGIELAPMKDWNCCGAFEYGDRKDELLTHAGARQILVVMALDPEKFGLLNSQAAEAVLNNLVKQGLRVKLALSGVTGLAFLELDYFPSERGSAVR